MPEGQRPIDRDFFWRIIATAQPFYYKTLVTDALEQHNRNAGKDEK